MGVDQLFESQCSLGSRVFRHSMRFLTGHRMSPWAAGAITGEHSDVQVCNLFKTGQAGASATGGITMVVLHTEPWATRAVRTTSEGQAAALSSTETLTETMSWEPLNGSGFVLERIIRTSGARLTTPVDRIVVSAEPGNLFKTRQIRSCGWDRCYRIRRGRDRNAKRFARSRDRGGV